jgi:hypothetical protein
MKIELTFTVKTKNVEACEKVIRDDVMEGILGTRRGISIKPKGNGTSEVRIPFKLISNDVALIDLIMDFQSVE